MTHPLEPDYYSLGLMGWILSAHIVFTLVAAVLLLRDTARSGRSRILWLAALFLFPVAGAVVYLGARIRGRPRGPAAVRAIHPSA